MEGGGGLVCLKMVAGRHAVTSEFFILLIDLHKIIAVIDVEQFASVIAGCDNVTPVISQPAASGGARASGWCN